jgi:hypothetical protein
MNPNPNAHPRDRVDLWLAGEGQEIKACFTCMFWEPGGGYLLPDHGQCRRNPPRMPRMGGFGEWPRTRRHDFCGEYSGALANE